MSTAKAPAAPSGRICEKYYVRLMCHYKRNMITFIQSSKMAKLHLSGTLEICVDNF